MSNKQSPFNGINYEWTYGSDGLLSEERKNVIEGVVYK